jgi:hypothetical protein
VTFGAGLGYFIAKWVVDMHSKDEAVAATASGTIAHPTSGLPTIYPFSLSVSF